MGGKGGGGEAAAARQDEEARQARIREGTASINRIFDGGASGSGKLDLSATYDPTATYYNADGSAWSPAASPASATSVAPLFAAQPESRQPNDGTGGVDRDGNRHGYMPPQELQGGTAPETQAADDRARQFQEALKNGTLYSGVSNTSGFGDDFFAGRRQAYLDYASPQLEDQYGKAQKELAFALSRANLLDSSVRGDKVAELQQKYDLNKQQIADQALASETDARNAVESGRADLISMLNATGDAQGAVNSAMSRAAALSQPAAFSPLTSLFADFTSGLGQQAALEKANAFAGSGAGQAQIGRYNTGLFGSNPNAVRVT